MIEKEIYTPETEYDEMIYDLENGKLKGTTTYVDELDILWKWRNGEVNLITGYANEGKSEYLKQSCLIKALEEDKHFIFYSPEDFPASEFFDGMIHTLSGKSTDRSISSCITRDEYDYYFDLIKDKFHFLYIKPPRNTIEEIENCFREIIELDPKVYGVIIDPYIKMSRSKFAPDRDDLYGAFIMNILGNLCRKEKVNGFIVMHQQTPTKDGMDKYPKPDKYNIKSGGTFADTADNVLSIWRPNYAKDKIDPVVVFSSLKIKKQKLVGIPDDFYMSFDRLTNRYCYKATDVPLYNWDKWKMKKNSPIKTF